MRAVVLAVCLLALLAVSPTVEAKPDPPQCVYGGLAVTVGPVTVSNYCGEGPRVSVDPCFPRGC
jgi:hypothetical protein